MTSQKWSPVFLIVGICCLFVQVIFATDGRCVQSLELQCVDDGRCIPLNFKCDGLSDCADHSDELGCPKNESCSHNQFRCLSGDCISSHWVCDGQADCNGGSDEVDCPKRPSKCSNDQFLCTSGSNCISSQWRCDGTSDCKDGEDELDCDKNVTCTSRQFRCTKEPQCIQIRWRCDGDKDCSDGTDEKECEATTCKTDEFKCINGSCIKNAWHCDGDVDCTDGSDEIDCIPTPSACSNNEFHCLHNHECFSSSWVCDGSSDCPDGSDERNCQNTCRPDQFRCNTNECIFGALQCNGLRDCSDGSDELNCTHGSLASDCNPMTSFYCETNRVCILLEKVCDNVPDCNPSSMESYRSQSADEDPAMCERINPCSTNGGNGDCNPAVTGRICKYTYSNQHCFCRPGFKLGKDNLMCEDINECRDVFGICSQKCTNTEGGYHCSCDKGNYRLEFNQPHACKATGPQPLLLFSGRKYVHMLNLRTQKTFPIVKEARSAIALDYDYQERQLFWTDSSQQKIFSAELILNDTTAPPTEKDWKNIANFSSADGIAVDWIHKLIYWTDTGENTIEVAKFDGSMQTVLISLGVDEPRGIVVDPTAGWLYWTDWNEKHPRIEKAGMNGAARKIIVDQNMKWPNDIAIDFVKERLYWIDGKLHLIGSSNFDGGDQRTILISQTDLAHPFSLSVFEDHVYWSDWGGDYIASVNKFHGNDTKHVAINLQEALGIHVVHPYKQPSGYNRCQNNAGCSHLCLPAPDITSRSVKSTCHCPTGYKSFLDGTKCLLTAGRPASVPAGNVSRVNISSAEAGDPSGWADQGHIAGLVIAACLLFAILVAVIAYVLHRQYKRKMVKSMNFDNPVYRKTTKATEENVNLDNNQYQPARGGLAPMLEPLNTLRLGEV